MKKSLSFYSIYCIIIFIATEVLALCVALNSVQGEFVMDNGMLIGWIVTLVVALISVVGTIVIAIIQSKKQGDVILDVRSHTSDMKPKVNNIDENTKKVRDEVVEKIIPSLKEFEKTSSKISDIHKDMEFKQRLKNETSPTLYDKDRFLGGIEKLYEENAKLTNENRNLKVELTDKELKLKSLEAELKVVRKENEMLKSTQTPTKSHNSMTQDFSL